MLDSTTLDSPARGRQAPTVPFVLTLMTPPPEAPAFTAAGRGGRWDPERQISVDADGKPQALARAISSFVTGRGPGETLDDKILAGRWW